MDGTATSGNLLVSAVQNEDTCAVKRLLIKCEDVCCRDEKQISLLHKSCAMGNLEIVKLLLEHGHPWNVVDMDGITAGEYAKCHGHDDVYEYLLMEGCRAELILGLLEGRNEDGRRPSNADFLSKPLQYSEDGTKLLDGNRDAVMMGWEKPLMTKHAKIICTTEGLDILNVGFGLGLIDAAIQSHKPRSHTIVEAHPDVFSHMLRHGWDKIPGVKIIFGRWQDVLDQLETYDGIFFDTFGEFYEDMREFHEELPNILKLQGVYSFFNGLGATNVFFHDVYCRIAELHLAGVGITTEFEAISIDPSADEHWEGVKNRYWTLNTYKLPSCRFISE